MLKKGGQVTNSICLKLVLAVVTETSVKNLGLAGSSEQLG